MSTYADIFLKRITALLPKQLRSSANKLSPSLQVDTSQPTRNRALNCIAC